MNYLYFLLVLVAGLHLVAGSDQGSKLRVGIKKRVENCEQKTRKNDLIEMHYTGTLTDGTEFDSSHTRGQPLKFKLGSGQVIKGWDQGLLGMCVGEKRRLVIPPELGYGSQDVGKIPADSTLIFETELMSIQRDGGEL